jgi:hypothetical protein
VGDDGASASVGLAADHLGATVDHLDWLAVRARAFQPPCAAQQRDVAVLHNMRRLQFKLSFEREKPLECRANSLGAPHGLRPRLGIKTASGSYSAIKPCRSPALNIF